MTANPLAAASTEELTAELRRRIPDPAITQVAGEVLAAFRHMTNTAQGAALTNATTAELEAELDRRHPAVELTADQRERFEAAAERALAVNRAKATEEADLTRDRDRLERVVAELLPAAGERDRARSLAARLEEELERTHRLTRDRDRTNTEHLTAARELLTDVAGDLARHRELVGELGELLVERGRLRPIDLEGADAFEAIVGAARRLTAEHTDEQAHAATAYGLLLEQNTGQAQRIGELELAARRLAGLEADLAREARLADAGDSAGLALARIAQAVSEHLEASTGQGDAGTADTVVALIAELANTREVVATLRSESLAERMHRAGWSPAQVNAALKAAAGAAS